MMLFGPSGDLNVEESKRKDSCVLVATKSLHSSEEDVVDQVKSDPSPTSSLQRRAAYGQNRKNHRNFRSVWYDEGHADEMAPRTEDWSLNFGTMRKAVSLDNLLKINPRTRYKVTKDMISSPSCPRKIEGPSALDWHAHFKTNETILEKSEIDNADKEDKETATTVPKIEVENLESTTVDTEINNSEDISDFSVNLWAADTDNKNEEDTSNETFELTTFNAPVSFVADVTVEEKNLVKKIEPKNAKMSTLEKRKRGRNLISKRDISTPLAPVKIQHDGSVITMDSLSTEGVTNLLRMKNISKSSDELLKSFSPIKNEDRGHINDPKFPITESDEGEEQVQIRRNNQIQQYRYSKTTDFDFGRKHVSNKDFDIRGCTKIQLPNETFPLKVKKNEIIKYQNGHFYKVDEESKKIIRHHVLLKSARLVNKKDVELKDTNNLTYTIYFDNSKDAKLLLENDRVHCYVENDSKSTITQKLLRLLVKRSSREVLEKKGIYQNEPIFGNTLRDIYRVEKGVPRFILETMKLIERPENIKSLGLYRTSGNLATIQKIRFEVDKGRIEILDEYSKDVDVLTGSLKLFFRELKEPLIPCDISDSLLNVTRVDKKYSKKDREKIRSVLGKLPEANLETLYVLIKHLVEVVKYKDENKMDTYNLSVCWGPTIIFLTESLENANGKDIVAQSADATRFFDSLLSFYIQHPEELDFGKKVEDDINDNQMHRQDSKDSIRSSDSGNSKHHRKNASNLSLNVDEILKKCVELIELNVTSEGLYKKSGSTEKIGKIMKKMSKKKVAELDKYKSDVNELTDSLKKYFRELPEPLATKECVEQIVKICDNSSCLEQNARHKIINLVEDLPKKDTLIYLLRHVIRVREYENAHKVTEHDLISIWTNVLNYQKRITDSNEKFSSFFKILLDVFDDSKPSLPPTPKGISNGLLNDLKNYQKDKDRCSKYDNVPDMEEHTVKQATILEEKTDILENTKL